VNVPLHLAALSNTGIKLSTADGLEIEIWEFSVPANAPYLSEWARRYRQTYCRDDEIDALVAGTPYSKAQYFNAIIFPDATQAPGPSVRAGDFAELLVADYLEFVLGYWVPRDKYSEKAVRDESVKGIDILGFQTSSGRPSPTDQLISFEVKAQLTGQHCTKRLQIAIDDSAKEYADELRRATTLNAIKRRLLRSDNSSDALRVQRFQNPVDHPYMSRSGAAAVLSKSVYDPNTLQQCGCQEHKNNEKLHLLVIRGPDLMALVHNLYERAANEA